MSVFWRPRGCVLWYDFAELQGDTVYDLSGNGNNGTIYNAEWRRGHLVGSLYFNGTDAYVEVPHSDSLNITDEITIEAFVKVISFVNAYPVIVGKGDAYVSRFKAEDTDKGRMMASWHIAGDWRHVYGNTVISAPALVHHVITFKSDVGTKMYLNGVLDKEAPTTGTLDTSTANVLIGNYEGLIRYLHGIIHFVRIYNRALSQREIRAHANYLLQKYIAHPPFI